jgi:hypothetical protein
MEVAMHGLAEELERAGRDPNSESISYLNVYFGVRHLQTESGHPWHVCVSRSYGFLCVIFHHVRHGDVHNTQYEEIDETPGLCITLMWTSDQPTEDELADAFQTADEMVQAIELSKGRPLPLPLKPMQLPDRFPVRTIKPDAKIGESVQTTIFRNDEKEGILADEMLVLTVGMQVKALGPLSDFFPDPLARAMHLSSIWQRRAIRSLGIEEWSNAIIASNVWLETFMVQLAVILNDANGTPIENVEELLMRRGLAGFVNNTLGSRFLMGRWDQTRTDTEFGAWHEHCYRMRNKIVHAGHIATEAEALAAYDAAHELAHHVTRRAAKLKQKEFSSILKTIKSMSSTQPKSKPANKSMS